MSGLVRALSFGRRPLSARKPQQQQPGDVKKTPRLTPRLIAPKTTQALSLELERASKTEPLGLKFALLADYYNGIVITEIYPKAGAAGFKVGDCVSFVGSREVSTVEDCEDSLKRIAGAVEVQVSRPKHLPAGWTSVDESDGRTVLKQRTLEAANTPKKALSRQHELTVHVKPSTSRGIDLSTDSSGLVIIHKVKKESEFYKHIRSGDKLFQVNGQDFSLNPIGASRAMTGADGKLSICGTFLPSAPECAATGCPCCTTIFGHRAARPSVAPKKVEAVEARADGKTETEVEQADAKADAEAVEEPQAEVPSAPAAAAQTASE